jgi:hypothetical protein
VIANQQLKSSILQMRTTGREDEEQPSNCTHGSAAYHHTESKVKLTPKRFHLCHHISPGEIELPNELKRGVFRGTIQGHFELQPAIAWHNNGGRHHLLYRIRVTKKGF